jgi:hypothetical protein
VEAKTRREPEGGATREAREDREDERRRTQQVPPGNSDPKVAISKRDFR